MELQLQHLSKCYGAKQAVDDVSTVLTPGVYALYGVPWELSAAEIRILVSISILISPPLLLLPLLQVHQYLPLFPDHSLLLLPAYRLEAFS